MAPSSILIGFFSLVGVGLVYVAAYLTYKHYHQGKVQFRNHSREEQRQGRRWYGSRRHRGVDPERGPMSQKRWREIQSFVGNAEQPQQSEPEPKQRLFEPTRPEGIYQPAPLAPGAAMWLRDQDELEAQVKYPVKPNPNTVPRKRPVPAVQRPLPTQNSDGVVRHWPCSVEQQSSPTLVGSSSSPSSPSPPSSDDLEQVEAPGEFPNQMICGLEMVFCF